MRVHLSHLLREEAVDLFGVFNHPLSSGSLLLLALHLGLHHPLHILKDHILMQVTKEQLQTHSGVKQTDRQVCRQIQRYEGISPLCRLVSGQSGQPVVGSESPGASRREEVSHSAIAASTADSNTPSVISRNKCPKHETVRSSNHEM